MDRSHATAFLLGTAAALVVDAVMQLAIDAVRVSTFSGSAPWWVTANLIGRGRWVLFAALLWSLAPRASSAWSGSQGGLEAQTTPEAWRQVSVALVAVPLLWLVATWLVSALRFTALGSWDTDGRVFISPDYYRGLALELTPWAMAAAVLMAVRRHL